MNRQLEVICGSMFSGKSEELIRRLKRAQLAQYSIIVFKHALDNQRTGQAYVASHSGAKLSAIPVEKIEQILELIPKDVDVVGIDEVQFFPNDIINVICTLIDRGVRVVVAGLDLDFRGVPFGCMPVLMAIADEVVKLKAICMRCGADAHFTQRLVDGRPAKHNDPLILVGAQESYQARCRSCHTIDQHPTF